MKRITTLLLIFLSFSHIQHALGQDTLSGKHVNEEDLSEQDDAPRIVVKNKHPTRAAVGIEAGFGNSYLLTGGSFNQSVVGWRAGAFAYIPIIGKLCLQPGLFYANSGGSNTVGGVTGSGGGLIVAGGTNTNGFTPNITSTVWNIQSIELPVNIGFRFGRRHSKIKSFIGIGAYVAYNIGGNFSYNESSAGSYVNTGSLKIGTDASSDIRPFDYGLGFNTSTEWRSGLLLRVRAQYGLANLTPQGPGYSSISTFGYGFQLGYIFGKKSRHKPRYHKDDEYIDHR